MTALQELRENVYALRQAHAQGDGERVWGLLDAIEDDLDVVERGRARDRLPIDHVCAVCETTCNEVTASKRAVRELQGQVLLLSYALHEAREIKDFTEREIEARFPRQRAA